MKPKHLVMLAVVVLVLVGLVALKEWSEQPPDIAQEAALTPLVPDGLGAADVAKLELYAGDKPDQKVVLARSDDGTAWTVASRFNAPVSKEKIDAYLEKMAGLKGEARPTAEGDDVMGAYELTDDKAFHVVAYRKGEEQPAMHLLVGKEANYQTVFARPADSKAVYQADVNLRSEAGLYGTGTELAADTWLDKEIVELTPDSITRVALNMPDKQLVLEKREKPAPEAPKPEGEAQTPETPPAPAAPTYEWVAVDGPPAGKALKDGAVQSYLSAFQPLYASDVVDPAKLAEYGLEQPAYRAAIKVQDQEGETVVEGGRPSPGAEDAYIRVTSGGKAGVVYKLTKMAFERVFPKGSQFFELANLSVDPTTVERVEITQPEGNVVLVKQDGAWTVEAPKANLRPMTTTLDTVASTLAAWSPEDYALWGDGYGLENPTRTATFYTGSGASHTVALGNDARSTDGAYARLDGDGTVLVMSKETIDKVFVAPKDLYERTLLETPAAGIQRIAVSRGDASFEASRKAEAPAQWTLTAGGAEVPNPRHTALEGLADTLATLQASDILFGKTQMDGAPMATVAFNAAGVEQTLSIGPEQEGSHQATLTGKENVFVLGAADVQALLPSPETLKADSPEQAAAPEQPALPGLPMTPEPLVIPGLPTAPEAAPLAPTEAPAPVVEAPAVETPAPAPAEAPVVEMPAPEAPLAPTEAPAPAAEAPAVETPAAAPAEAPAETPAAPVEAPATEAPAAPGS